MNWIPKFVVPAALLVAGASAAIPEPTPAGLDEFSHRLASGKPVHIGLYGSSTYAGVWTSDGAQGSTVKGPGYWMQVFLNTYYMNSAAVVDSSSSVPGSTTTDFLAKWDALMASTQNEVVIIGWGSNDCNVLTPEQFRRNLQIMIATARRAGRTVVLDTPHQTTAFAGMWRAHALQQFAQVIRQLAHESAIPLIDSQEWSEQLWRTNVSLPHWIGDGVHLSPEGLKAKGALMASLFVGNCPRVSGDQVISTDLPDWNIATDKSSLRPATRYGRAAGGKSFRLAFYVERAGLDLYVAIPEFSGGGEITVRIDGDELQHKIVTLNADMEMDSGFRYDVDTMIAENLPVGFHLVELDSSVTSLVYYARFTASRASSLLTPAIETGQAQAGFARYAALADFVMRKGQAGEGVLLTDIPVSNHLRETSVQLSAQFAPEEGFVLFASRYGTVATTEVPRGGLYLYLGPTGHLTAREWRGKSGYTSPVELAEDDLSKGVHVYTANVNTAGTLTAQVDGVTKGSYNLRVPRTGGFLGFYKKTIGTMTVSSVSIH